MCAYNDLDSFRWFFRCIKECHGTSYSLSPIFIILVCQYLTPTSCMMMGSMCFDQMNTVTWWPRIRACPTRPSSSTSSSPRRRRSATPVRPQYISRISITDVMMNHQFDDDSNDDGWADCVRITAAPRSDDEDHAVWGRHARRELKGSDGAMQRTENSVSCGYTELDLFRAAKLLPPAPGGAAQPIRMGSAQNVHVWNGRPNVRRLLRSLAHSFIIMLSERLILCCLLTCLSVGHDVWPSGRCEQGGRDRCDGLRQPADLQRSGDALRPLLGAGGEPICDSAQGELLSQTNRYLIDQLHFESSPFPSPPRLTASPPHPPLCF